MSKLDEVSDILEMQLKGVDTKTAFEEVGTVLEVGDGVAHVFGLDNVRSSELVEFENGVRGVAMNLEQDNVGVILMNAGDRVKENFTVKRTGHIASIRVGDGLLGRVVNTLGDPIDGAGPVAGDTIELPLDRKAPGVIFRQPVKEPLQTGIKSCRFDGSDRKRTTGIDYRRPANGKDSHCHRYDSQSESEFYEWGSCVLHLCRYRTESFFGGYFGEYLA